MKRSVKTKKESMHTKHKNKSLISKHASIVMDGESSRPKKSGPKSKEMVLPKSESNAMEIASSSDSDDSAPEEMSSGNQRQFADKTGQRPLKATTYEESSDEDEIESRDNEEGSDSEEDEEDMEEESNDEEESNNGEEDHVDTDDRLGNNSLDTKEPEPSSDEFSKLRKELSNLPFDEIQSLKEKIGIKMFNQVMFGKGKSTGPRRFKRENKNRPMEISSKVRPRKLRQVMEVKKRMTRDPRFDDLSGAFREDIYSKTYAFLGDIKQNEKEKVKKLLNKERNEEKKEKLNILYKRMLAQEKDEKQRDTAKQREQERRRQERELLAQGKKPFFLKNSDKKKLELADKYKELKRKGKLDQYLSKKRKRNAGKEKRNLPS